jgi:broad specificity phosphatase PhoE
MPPRIVYVARHGETDWNLAGRWQGATDVPLNARGREQAVELGERLKHHEIGAVVASDLSRARETGEIVAAILAVPFVGAHAGLRERGYGVIEGLTRDECRERHPEVFERASPGGLLAPPGCEPWDAVAARMVSALEAFVRGELGPAAAAAGRRLLAISHGGAMRTFFSHASGILVPPVRNAAVYCVVHDGERFGPPSPIEDDVDPREAQRRSMR